VKILTNKKDHEFIEIFDKKMLTNNQDSLGGGMSGDTDVILNTKHLKWTIVSFFGTILIIWMFLTSNWIIFMQKINFEKEKYLRFTSNLMGMKSSSYWTALFTFQFLMNFISFLIGYGLGFVLKIEFFYFTNPYVILIIFSTMISSMLILAIFLSVLVSNITLSCLLIHPLKISILCNNY
jgi:hypothetical protein